MDGVQIYWKDRAGNEHTLDELALFDAMTNALVSIGCAHYRIHEGSSFTTNFTDEVLANDETLVIAFKTAPGTKRVHLFVFFSTLVGGSLELWEGATWTEDTGTATPIINRRRDENLEASGMLEDKTYTPAFRATGNVLVNPTHSVVGATSLDKQYAWGEKGKIGAGYLRDENEFILKPDTQYAVVFTAIGAANKAQVSLNWYEQSEE